MCVCYTVSPQLYGVRGAAPVAGSTGYNLGVHLCTHMCEDMGAHVCVCACVHGVNTCKCSCVLCTECVVSVRVCAHSCVHVAWTGRVPAVAAGRATRTRLSFICSAKDLCPQGLPYTLSRSLASVLAGVTRDTGPDSGRAPKWWEHRPAGGGVSPAPRGPEACLNPGPSFSHIGNFSLGGCCVFCLALFFSFW